MVVSVERDLLARWQNGSNVLLRVRSPEDPVRLRAALTAARREIAALGPDTGSGAAGPAYLSPLIAVPDGQLMIVDFNGVPPATVRAVPELVARHLTDGGIRDAVVDTPQRIGDRYATVTAFAPAARAWLRGPLGTPFGPAPRDAPGYLLDAVVEWVRQPPEPDPIGVIVSMELPLTWSTVGGALMPALATGSSVAVVASDFQTSAIAGAVQGRFGGTVPQASLTMAGRGLPPAALVAAMVHQRELARAYAGRLVWAGVTASPDARDTLSAAGTTANRRSAASTGRRGTGWPTCWYPTGCGTRSSLPATSPGWAVRRRRRTRCRTAGSSSPSVPPSSGSPVIPTGRPCWPMRASCSPAAWLTRPAPRP